MGPINFALLQKHVLAVCLTIHGQHITCPPQSPPRLSVWISLFTCMDILFIHTYPRGHSHLKYSRPLQTPNPEIPT